MVVERSVALRFPLGAKERKQMSISFLVNGDH